MNHYIAIPVEVDHGCEGCCFGNESLYGNASRQVFYSCTRPDSVPHCQQTTQSGEVIEYIYEESK